MFLNPLSHAFGLDIGDLSAKVVQLHNRSYISRHPKFAVAAYRSISLPPGLIVNGELIQPEEIRKHILELLGRGEKKKNPIKGHWVVASIPESQSAIKLIEIAKEPHALTEDDVTPLSLQHIPFEAGTYYLDWQIIPREATDEDDEEPAGSFVLLCATPKAIADSYTYLLESLGLGLIALEVKSVATARTMITADKDYDGEARLVLDIGATGTSAIVYDHHTIQFSTSLPFSGELLTTAIAQKKNIDHDAAEEEKKKSGISFGKGDAWPVLAKLVEDLEAGIRKTIDFYYSHFPAYHPISRITLCGGVASMHELSKVLSSALGIETAPGNPWKNLSVKQAPAKNGEALRYATAIGLALHAADNPLLTHDSV